jgi:hypothetical protein
VSAHTSLAVKLAAIISRRVGDAIAAQKAVLAVNADVILEPNTGTAARQQTGGTRTTGLRPTWSTATSAPPGRTSCGVSTSLMCRRWRGSSISPPCSTPGAARSSGWAMANHLRAELVLDAMEMAVGQRRPKDVIHHSDQGSQLEFNQSSQQQCAPIS